MKLKLTCIAIVCLVGVFVLGFGTEAQAVPPSENFEVRGNCGSRCLYTLLVAESVPLPRYEQFLQQHPTCRQEEIGLDAIATIASEHGLKCDLIRFDPTIELPQCRHLIAHVDPGHFVVLSQSERGLWYCLDPPGRPAVLSPTVRTKLTGAALAVDLDRDSSMSRLITVAISICLLIMLYLVWKRLYKQGLKSVLGAWLLCVAAFASGCSQSKNDTTAQSLDLLKLAFVPAVVELGDLSRSAEYRLVNLKLVGISPDDFLKVTASCGCADATVGAYNVQTNTRSVIVKIDLNSLEQKRVQVVAVSSRTQQTSMSEIVYRVVDQIALSQARPVFKRDDVPNRYASEIEILNDPNQKLARVAVLLSSEQDRRGIQWESYRDGQDRFVVRITNPINAAYEHAYISFLDTNGAKLHPEVPIEWGEVDDLTLSVNQVELSQNKPFASLVLHSDRDLPRLLKTSSTVPHVNVVAKELAPNLMRMELSLQSTGSESVAIADGALTIDFEDGRNKSIPIKVIQP